MIYHNIVSNIEFLTLGLVVYGYIRLEADRVRFPAIKSRCSTGGNYKPNISNLVIILNTSNRNRHNRSNSKRDIDN